MNSSITVSFSYRTRDFIRAWQARFASHSHLKQNLMFSLIIAVWALYMSYAPRSRFEWALFNLSTAALLLLISGSLAFRSLIPRIIFALSPQFREAYTVTLAPGGVRVQTPHADSKLDWSRYFRAILGTEEYILCNGRSQFGVIPKRAFQNPEDLRVFEEMLIRFVPEVTKPEV